MNLTFGNMTLEVNTFHVGKPQVSTFDQPTFVDTLEKEDEFEPLIEQPLDSFSFDNSYVDHLYHDVGNAFASCDNVQMESVTSWLPHGEHPMSVRMDLKDEERLELEPLVDL